MTIPQSFSPLREEKSSSLYTREPLGAEEDGERGEGMKTVQILRALLKVAEFFGEVQQVHLYDGGLITIDGAGYQLQFLRK